MLPTDLVLNLYCYPIYEPQNILKSTHVGLENQTFLDLNDLIVLNGAKLNVDSRIYRNFTDTIEMRQNWSILILATKSSRMC